MPQILPRPRIRAAAAASILALALFSCGPKTPPKATPQPPPSKPAAAPTAAPVVVPPPIVATSPSAPGAVTVAVPVGELAPTDVLRFELDRIFKSPTFDRMMWGVQVQSLTTGEMLYAVNETKLMMPASNMKIVTLAAAAERLGWDYTFETKVVPKGPVESGTLRGDLVVVGSGDPTMNARGGNPTAVFEEWATTLRSAGVSAIDGRVIADDRIFDAESLGAGWSWDYLVDGYAAPVTALQFNENVAEVVVRPGLTEGTAATVIVRPDGSGLTVVNRITTAPPGGRASLQFRRMAGSNRLAASGTIPVGSAEVLRTVAVDEPGAFFAQAFKNVLVQKGISVRGEAISARGLEQPPDVSGINALITRKSAPLGEIAKVLMKVSQNLYAETLLKTLGVQAGLGTVESGQMVVREVLESWGVPPDSHVLVDGSGLSRYNYVTSQMLVQILRRIYTDTRHRQAFMESLPIAGVDGGTLARRMRGTRAANNVRAKTGSISNVRALSGYVTTADGEPMVFSIIANNFTLPQAAIDQTIDLAAERLANFTRKPVVPTAGR